MKYGFKGYHNISANLMPQFEPPVQLPADAFGGSYSTLTFIQTLSYFFPAATGIMTVYIKYILLGC